MGHTSTHLKICIWYFHCLFLRCRLWEILLPVWDMQTTQWESTEVGGLRFLGALRFEVGSHCQWRTANWRGKIIRSLHSGSKPFPMSSSSLQEDRPVVSPRGKLMNKTHPFWGVEKMKIWDWDFDVTLRKWDCILKSMEVSGHQLGIWLGSHFMVRWLEWPGKDPGQATYWTV